MQNIKKNNLSFFNQLNNKKIIYKINNYFKNDQWVNGKIVNKFELSLKKYLKTKNYLCGCNSGTDALKIAILLDKPKKNSIYLTTPLSYISTSSVIKSFGLHIIYIDVEKDNFLLDIDKLENFLNKAPKNVKKKIKGIIFVELFGETTNLKKLSLIAKKHNLTLIGDCAQSLGSKYLNKSTCEYYDYSAYSFYPTKILPAYGDGGALVVKNKLQYKNSILLRNNGHQINNKNSCKLIGINSRLDSIQAFILNENLKDLNKQINLKKKIKKYYDKYLPNIIQKPKINKNVQSNNYIYSINLPSKLRQKFIDFMYKNKMQCKIYYKKLLPDSKILKPKIKNKLIFANYYKKSLVCLPNNNLIKLSTVKKISKLIKIFLKNNY